MNPVELEKKRLNISINHKFTNQFKEKITTSPAIQ